MPLTGALFITTSEGATYTYSSNRDVKAFVNSLAANESFKARLLRDTQKSYRYPGWPRLWSNSSHCCQQQPHRGERRVTGWSVTERRFLKKAVPAEKVGLVTPRAFSRYDPFKVPQPKYFQEVLVSSLTENEIGLFREDFLLLFIVYCFVCQKIKQIK